MSAECTESLTGLRQGLSALANLAGVCGMVGSVQLLRICLRGQQRGSVLGRLVICMATADLALNTWNFVPSWVLNHDPLLRPFVPWCPQWVAASKVLQLWSAVLALFIAIGLLFALLKQEGLLKLLRFAPVLSLPLGALLALGFILNSDHWHLRHGDPSSMQPTCAIDGDLAMPLWHAFIGEACLIFGFLAATHLFGLIRLRRLSPKSVVKRAFASVGNFLLAFLAAWSGTVLYAVLHFFTVVGYSSCTDHMIWLVLLTLQDGLLALGGLFNLLAYREVGIKTSRGRFVAFGDQETLQISAREHCQEEEQEEQFFTLLRSYTIGFDPEEALEADSQGSHVSTESASSFGPPEGSARGIEMG